MTNPTNAQKLRVLAPGGVEVPGGVAVRVDRFAPKRHEPKRWRVLVWYYVLGMFDFPRPQGARWMAMVNGVLVCHPETFDELREALATLRIGE